MRQSVFQQRYGVSVLLGVVSLNIIDPIFLHMPLNETTYMEILQNKTKVVWTHCRFVINIRIFFQQKYSLDSSAHNSRVVTNDLDDRFEQNWSANNGPIR